MIRPKINPAGNAPSAARLPKPVVTSPMKKVPRLGRRVSQQVSASNNTEALIETLRQRVNELEERLATLEEVVRIDGGDVVICAPQSVLIQGLASVEISAGAWFKISAANYECNTALAKFSGIIQSDTLICNSVVSASYTPGAGNIM